MKRPPIAVTLALTLSLILASCSAAGQDTQPQLVIRYGNIYPTSTTFGRAIDVMAERISTASGGRIRMEVFHSGKLGSEQSHIEAVRAGSLEMAQTGTAGIGLFVPETALFELWYAFDDVDTLVTAFEKVRPKLDRTYRKEGFKLLGAFYNGPRSIISTTPIRSLSDVQDLQLRVPASDLYVRMANALGARAVALPLGDAYTGLQTGTIDAMEGAPDDLVNGGYGEVAKYLTLDRHVYHPLSIVYNLEGWKHLSQQQQQVILDAVEQASKFQRAELARANAGALAKLKRYGVEIIELTDRKAWARRIESASNDFAEQFAADGRQIITAIRHAEKGSS